MAKSSSNKVKKSLKDLGLTEEMVSDPVYFFDNYTPENKVKSVDGYIKIIDCLYKRSKGPRKFVYRGQENALWPLYSTLYRKLKESYDVKGKVQRPREADLLAVERKITQYLRRNWRLDDLSHLELIAQLQHFGAPTRLIDVSLNPLVALWFSVRSNPDTDQQDGRIFIFDITNQNIHTDNRWGTYDIPWDTNDRKCPKDWPKALPKFWSPPAYNDRIPAQYAGFIMGGVPSFRDGNNTRYRKSAKVQGNYEFLESPGVAYTWTIDEVLTQTCVHTHLRSIPINGGPQCKSNNTYSIKIDADSKGEIRKSLEKVYGINRSTLFPDMPGMAFEILKSIQEGYINDLI